MKERVEYRVDSFVDFTGMERKFVMVALSQEVCLKLTQIQRTGMKMHS